MDEHIYQVESLFSAAKVLLNILIIFISIIVYMREFGEIMPEGGLNNLKHLKF